MKTAPPASVTPAPGKRPRYMPRNPGLWLIALIGAGLTIVAVPLIVWAMAIITFICAVVAPCFEHHESCRPRQSTRPRTQAPSPKPQD